MLRRILAVLCAATLWIPGVPMAVSPDLLRAAVKYGHQYGVPPDLLVATALQESGGNLNAVGDHGTSFGPYQMHQGGRLTSYHYSPQQAQNADLATKATAEDFSHYKTGNLGTWAARAQRPANAGAYAQHVNGLLDTARKLLGGTAQQSSVLSGGAADLSSLGTNSGTPSQGLNLAALSSRPEGQSLTEAVRGQLITQRLSGQGPGQGGPIVDSLPQGAPTQRSANAVVAAAERWLGTPYSWGGGGPSGPGYGIAQGRNTKGFDCSSLIQYAWAKQGVKLPRTTYGQIRAGSAVGSLSQARPGDLLFPSRGHVQMFIGNGKVIESPHTGAQVRLGTVRDHYIAIRRPG